jgi:phospholipid-translocating ATPase
LQIALDTFYWNPVMHVVVWGSILVWFVVIPVTSTAAFSGTFFLYGGVAYEVLNTAEFWFYLPITVVAALFPTMVSRLIALYRTPAYVDFVRLKEKKEGKKLFKRKKASRRPVSTYGSTLKRTGYAFSHQKGFGSLIASGHMFGMNEDAISAERSRRQSVLLSASPSRAEPSVPGVPSAAIIAVSSLTSAVLGIGGSQSGDDITTDVGIQRESRTPDDDHTRIVETEETIGSAGDGGSVQHPPPAEETDSALVTPTLRIPGLVDSPAEEEAGAKDKDAATSDDQEGSATRAESEPEEPIHLPV